MLRLRADARGGDEREPPVDVPEQGFVAGPAAKVAEKAKAKAKQAKKNKPGKKSKKRKKGRK